MRLTARRPFAYLITKGEARTDDLGEQRRQILGIVRIAVEQRVPLVQVREKGLSAGLLFALVKEVVEITAPSDTRVLVNDRLDIALAAGADGVHLTSRSLRADTVRKVSPKGFLIGVSTHSAEEVRQAATQGADFVLFGPVFESPGKAITQGIDKLADICADSKLPVIAVGGIDKQNVSEVLAAGASGVAAIRAFNKPASLRGMLELLRQ